MAVIFKDLLRLGMQSTHLGQITGGQEFETSLANMVKSNLC